VEPQPANAVLGPQLRVGFDRLDDVDVHAVRIDESEAPLASRLVSNRVIERDADVRDVLECGGRVSHLECQESARARPDGGAVRRVVGWSSTTKAIAPALCPAAPKR
jgi:hypothetical protein